ncbi:MAG: methyltransferase [Myxococcota bacterium]|nr:methyltransferase [Myxococcota bacterium]
MSKATQTASIVALIERNQSVLEGDHLLIAGAPPLDLCRADLPLVERLTVLAEHRGLWARLNQEEGVDARFTFTARGDEAAQRLLFFWPKSHEAAIFLLEQARCGLAPDGELWLVGENQGGIKQAPKRLAPLLDGPLELVDNARRCRIFRGRLRAQGEPPQSNEVPWTHWSLPCERGAALTICSLPGVFAHGALDTGSARLIEQLRRRHKQARQALDFGCGAGPLGLTLLQEELAEVVELADVSAIALAAAEESARQNGLDDRVRLRPVIGAASLQEEAQGPGSSPGTRYKLIVSNPPFHEGRSTSYQPSRDLIERSPKLLRRGGELYLVANRFLPYQEPLQHAFGSEKVSILWDGPRFRVYHGTRRSPRSLKRHP